MDSRRSISPPGFHHGDNPIPAACRVGDLLVSGGVNPVDYTTGESPSDVAEQMSLVFRNIETILGAAGATTDQIAKIDVNTDPEHREILNRVWVDHFPDPASRPARKLTSGPRPKGFLVQCEFIAFVETDRSGGDHRGV